MKVTKHSGLYTLYVEQVLPISLEEAWDFFSSPANLGKITPEYMGFKITSDNLQKMYAGQIISYKIGILPGIKSDWVTEITHVDELKYFVDEQRFGPYSMWHHEHTFRQTDEGVLMTDRVTYKIPFGFLGHIAQALFVGKQVKSIFNYRYHKLNELFTYASERVLS